MKMNLKYWLTICLWLFTVGFSFSQQNKIDSLRSMLSVDRADTARLQHFNLLARSYADIGTFDSAMYFAKEALRTADRIPGSSGKAGASTAYNTIGIVFMQQGEYPKSLENYFNALKISEELEDRNKMAMQYGNLGNAYNAQANYKKALEYYFKALKIGEELKDKKRISIQLDNIGIAYYNSGDWKKALEFYSRSLKIAQEIGHKYLIASVVGNMGSLYIDKAGSKSFENDSAREMIFENAFDYAFKGLKLAEELESKDGMTIQLGNIGLLYMYSKKYEEAEKYLARSIAMAEEIGSLDDIKVGNQGLSTLFEKKGDYKNALNHYKLFIAAKDSLFNEEKNKEITRKEMNYEFEKKEAAAKAEQEKQAAVAAAEKQRQRIVLILVSCVLFLVLIFAGFIFRALRITNHQKQIIEEQKKHVEEKQKEILDSIHYARRIQTALLPTEKYIDKTLGRLIKT